MILWNFLVFLNALMFASFCCGILAGQFKLVLFFLKLVMVFSQPTCFYC